MEKEEKKKGFIMYLDYEQHFKLLSDEQLGKLLRIIYEYERTENFPNIDDGMIIIAFSFIKAQLDRDKTKYEKEIIKRKVAGKKGSEARWNNDDNFFVCGENEKTSNAIKNMANDSIAIKSIAKNGKRKRDIVNIADTDKVTVTDTDTEEDIVVDAVDNKEEILKYYRDQTKENPPATAILTLFQNNLSVELIKKAIDISVLRKKTNLDYISGILKSWKSKGFESIEDVESEGKKSNISTNINEFKDLYEN